MTGNSDMGDDMTTTTDDLRGVDLAFPYDDDFDVWADISDLLDGLAEDKGGVRVSGGTGFGLRDMQFEFPTETAAAAFVAAAEATGTTFDYIGVADLAVDDDLD